eukprot:NODE_223_length_13915_cov_0.128257.p2 type:complete len:626 gc:universal NODE_223_length_13915_cov_0.128257:109-1986(+)
MKREDKHTLGPPFIFNELVIGCDRFIKEDAPILVDLMFDGTDMSATSEHLKLLLSQMYHRKEADFRHFLDICRISIRLFDSVNTNEYYMSILILNLYSWIDKNGTKSIMLKNVDLILALLNKITTHFNHQLIRNTIALISQIFHIFATPSKTRKKTMQISIDDYYALQNNLFTRYQFILPNLPLPFVNKSSHSMDPNKQPIHPLPQSIKQVINLYSNYLTIKDKDYCWYREYQEMEKSASLTSMGISAKQAPSLNKQDPFSLFVKAFVPNLNDFVLILLKLLLIGAPMPSKYGGNTPETSPYASTLFVKDQISAIHLEMNRYREALFYFIVEALLNLLDCLKSDDIILEYVKCLLNDANLIPLFLKILQFKDPVKFIQGIPDRSSLNILPEVGPYCTTTFKASLNAFKILNKISRHSVSRSIMLAVHKSPDVLKKWNLINNSEIQIASLKLLKIVFPYATRKFRQTNMKIASQIYCTLKFEPFESFLKFEDTAACQLKGDAKDIDNRKVISHKLDRLLGAGHWSNYGTSDENKEIGSFLRIQSQFSISTSIEDVSAFTNEMMIESKEMIRLFISRDINQLVNEDDVAAEEAQLWVQSFSDLFFSDDRIENEMEKEQALIVVDEIS